MEKLLTILLISSLFFPATIATSRNPPSDAETWFKNISRRKEKVAKLHFFIQDALGAPNATVWEVARADITAQHRRMFGQIRVLDDKITAGPGRDSEELGRAQGLITSADLVESGLAMNMNIVFTAGEYNGSTLCILGRNPIDTADRELPVVAGTGIFRMGRGFSISNTYSFDPVENYGVLEYTVYVTYV